MGDTKAKNTEQEPEEFCRHRSGTSCDFAERLSVLRAMNDTYTAAETINDMC